MDVHPKALPLIKLLDYVRATFKPLTVDRGLTFDVKVGENVPKELFSDEQRLQQILRNLLSNAVKFTSSGSVELIVQRVPGTEFEEESLRTADDVIALSVKDTGIGISPEKLDGIFEAFQQSDGTTNRKYGGTGLGLSISRDMASLLGGRIIAESEPGVGSTFTLYVPARYTGPFPAPSPTAATRPADSTAQAGPARPVLAEQLTAAPSPASTSTARSSSSGDVFATKTEQEQTSHLGSHSPDGSDVTWPETTRLKDWLSGRPGEVLVNRRILIVDDDIRNVFALTHVLGRVGIRVKYAENGREGLEVLDRTPDVSLVLMDIMMPEMDGYEMIKAIRQAPRFADLPVIALTAKAMPGDREKAIESGANDYIPKPVDVDRLLTVICGLLDPENCGMATAPDPDSPESPDSPHSHDTTENTGSSGSPRSADGNESADQADQGPTGEPS